MTFLQLAQSLREKCGITGTGPAAVTSQTGENLRLVNWIIETWREIQNKKHNWLWMRRDCTITTTTGQSEYAAAAWTDTTDSAVISRFASWLHESDYGVPNFTIYETSTGVSAERRLNYMPWDLFTQIYRFGTQNNGIPSHFSITPNNKIALGPKPDSTGYTVTGKYQMSSQELAANGDIPEMPVRFHMLIVYEAMKKYAIYESAPEVFDGGDAQAKTLWGPLKLDQLPKLVLADPLA